MSSTGEAISGITDHRSLAGADDQHSKHKDRSGPGPVQRMVMCVAATPGARDVRAETERCPFRARSTLRRKRHPACGACAEFGAISALLCALCGELASGGGGTEKVPNAVHPRNHPKRNKGRRGRGHSLASVLTKQ